MLPPKYVNPADSSQTWTGRGVPPVWVVEIRKFGDLENCLIDSLRNSEQPKKALRNYQQTDWTGEQGGSLVEAGFCSVCRGLLPFQIGAGRPAVFCSDKCKMRAYRQRKTTQARRVESVESASNTHTKPWYPMVNDNKAGG